MPRHRADTAITSTINADHGAEFPLQGFSSACGQIRQCWRNKDEEGVPPCLSPLPGTSFPKKKKKKLEKQTNKKTTNVQSCLIISEKKGKMTSDNKMIFKIPLTYSFSFIPVHPNVLCNFI